MGIEAREIIVIEAPQWGSNDSTSLIAESRGRVQAIRVESGKVLATVNREDVESVRELMKARGLKVIEQSV